MGSEYFQKQLYVAMSSSSSKVKTFITTEVKFVGAMFNQTKASSNTPQHLFGVKAS